MSSSNENEPAAEHEDYQYDAITTSSPPLVFHYTSGAVVPSHVTHIRVDETVEELEDNTFKELFDLLAVELPLTLLYLGTMAFYCCANLTTVNIPPHLIEIPDDTFHSCRNLENVVLPVKLEIIGQRAFFECEAITEFNYPPTLKVIGRAAFVHCRSLVKANFPDSLEALGDRSFVGCESLETISVPSGISKIQRGTFSHCHSLTVAGMSEGLEAIGEGAFWSCLSLGRVRIPSSVNVIESSAFRYCTSLESVELSYGISSVGSMVFHGCENLSNIALPPSLNDVSEHAFDDCNMLLIYPKEKLFPKLRERFDYLPLHRLCYDHQSPLIDNIIEGDYGNTRSVDTFGMLPYHILSLSTKLNLELFEKLLKDDNSNELALVSEPDKFGMCPMYYLCGSNESNAIHAIRDILKLATADRIGMLGLERWKLEVSQGIEDIVYGDVLSARRKRIHEIYRKLLSNERLEAISLLELAVWNAEVETASTLPSATLNDEERKACRIKSGVGIVIPNVMAFLGDDIDELPFKS
mmetsp:Transcript_35027/g.84791  ORF Transcript_35027/g.84791 Transcript_35027/m.84791 type:complete len:525 (+) Transcript_35027:125-1699(+)|eukprot:CAMPEP_0113653296 /NCGR_PEP_ID=MMETSP0017_2-20120614/28500_1 /TAXON_ID=2856 /ORGANISM="Cylindrotheca closterium" /LENGTH=524 /DNA_ID=CAMNT_0000566273 /DNA_START=65 /DNA_END=1639 /DNA_ORIENTATION=+ /assembly_acc=CAM_ASM_000147